MKKTNTIVTLVIAAIGIGLIGFQNFTRYKPRELSRDARDLYMGDALATALRDAEKAEQKRKIEIDAQLENSASETISDQVVEKPIKVGRKTSSANLELNDSAQ